MEFDVYPYRGSKVVCEWKLNTAWEGYPAYAKVDSKVKPTAYTLWGWQYIGDKLESIGCLASLQRINGGWHYYLRQSSKHSLARDISDRDINGALYSALDIIHNIAFDSLASRHCAVQLNRGDIPANAWNHCSVK